LLLYSVFEIVIVYLAFPKAASLVGTRELEQVDRGTLKELRQMGFARS